MTSTQINAFPSTWYGEDFKRRNNEGINPLKMGLKIKKSFTAAAETILKK